VTFVLTLIFTCGVGCGTPARVTLAQTYPTKQACQQAGAVWLSPAANPTKTVRAFTCTPVSTR